MSQDSYRTDSPAASGAGDLPFPKRFASPPVAGEPGVDPELVEQTRSQIRTLVQEIGDLAKSEISAEEFYEGFLVRTTSALASAGGILWIRQSVHRPFELKYQINVSQTPLASDESAQTRHSQLLQRVASRGEPALVPPHSGFQGSESAANPTDLLLIFGPLVVDGELVGLVEVFQRPGGGPATQRGYLRFLTQMSEVASDFLRNQRLRSYSREQQHWQSLEQFSRRIHAGLDPQRTAYALANEGRRLLDCDRVSVAEVSGQKATLLAVSGLDTVERRADQVKSLSRLVSVAIRAGQPVWYCGDSSGLAPQIESQLQQYVDRSQSRMVAILPLAQSPADEPAGSPSPGRMEKTREKTGRIFGALILENLRDSRADGLLRERAAMVAIHASLAMGNAAEHHSIFLLPLWKGLAWMASPFSSTRWPRTLAALALAAGLVALLFLCPWQFNLGCRGQLIAEKQQEIFARIQGTLVEVNEPDNLNDVIPAGSVLAVMVNDELQQEIENVQGRINESREQYAKLERARQSEKENKNIILLTGDLEKEAQTRLNLERQLQILQNRAADLKVVSPISGRIANWQLRRNLLGRPVQVGQNLMTVVAPDTDWQAELFLPEKKVGHLLDEMEKNGAAVKVSFTLASRPGEEFTGQIVAVDQVMDVYDDQGNAARVLVSFDNRQLAADLRRSGTRITARLHCGTRPAGYVLFRELIETTASTWRFWF